jgi:hypothetical protein
MLVAELHVIAKHAAPGPWAGLHFHRSGGELIRVPLGMSTYDTVVHTSDESMQADVKPYVSP